MQRRAFASSNPKKMLQVSIKNVKDKSETTAKVLKNIIDTQDEIIEDRKLEGKSDNEEMEIDEAVGEWIQQQKRKKAFEKIKSGR